MRKLFTTKLFALLILITSIHCPEHAKPIKTLLVVVAHPDDETGFGPVLARYARLGHKVFLAIAVDGRYSLQAGKNLPDSVAIDNANQVICSCEKLGIEQPIFYELISLDRKHGNKDGVKEAVETGVKLRDKIKQTIHDLQPDLIITYGPDGEYGHPEHIIVSANVTELLLREQWVDKYPLYYFGWPKSTEEGNDGWVRYADDLYFNATIEYSDEDEKKAMESLNCYERMPQNERLEIMEIERQRINEMYFRKFVVAKGDTKDFFD